MFWIRSMWRMVRKEQWSGCLKHTWSVIKTGFQAQHCFCVYYCETRQTRKPHSVPENYTMFLTSPLLTLKHTHTDTHIVHSLCYKMHQHTPLFALKKEKWLKRSSSAWFHSWPFKYSLINKGGKSISRSWFASSMRSLSLLRVCISQSTSGLGS